MTTTANPQKFGLVNRFYPLPNPDVTPAAQWKFASPHPGGNQQPVYIYLHGFTGSGSDADLIIARDNGTRQWASIDWLGHGKSSAPMCGEYYRLNWQLNALRSHIQSIEPRRPIVLIGYSMGGRLALQFALHFPKLISRMVLISASPGIEDSKVRTARWQLDYIRSRQILDQGLSHFCHEWQKLPILKTQQNIPNPYRDELRQRRFEQTPIGLANAIIHLSPGVLPSLWHRLQQIRTPTLLITGSLDQKFTEIAVKMAAKMPQARHAEFHNTGHTPHLEDPARFLELLDKERLPLMEQVGDGIG